jgi:hypothetical protein
MGSLGHANNQELLSTLAGAHAAETLMKQWSDLTSLARASVDELPLVKGMRKPKAAAHARILRGVARARHAGAYRRLSPGAEPHAHGGDFSGRIS